MIGHPALLTTDKKFLIEFANRMSHLKNALKAVYKIAIGRADRKSQASYIPNTERKSLK